MSEKKDIWTVGDVLNAMSGGSGAVGRREYPDYIVRLSNEIQAWLAAAVSEDAPVDLLDIATGSQDRGPSGDIEDLFSRIEWSFSYAEVIPAAREYCGRSDAVILSVGPIVLDEGLRMMVDHAALFGADTCRRVWVISDTWMMADIIAYMPHVRALAERGIELRFLLVTPWAWSEIPWSSGMGAAR